MNLVVRFLEQAAEAPERLAIRHGRARLTYGELARRVRRGMGRLGGLGLAPGSKVLVLVPLGPELYEVLLAVVGAGLCAVFLDPSSGLGRMGEACEQVRPSVFIGTWKAQLLRLLLPGLRRIPLNLGLAWPLARPYRSGRTEAEPAPCLDDHPALLTFTTGSTGRPKAALRTHGFLGAQHAVLARTLEHRPGQVDLATLPIFVLANLLSGQTTLLPQVDLSRPGRIPGDRVREEIRRAGPETAAASPAFFERLCARAAPGSLASFRALFTGGAPVFPSLLERLRKAAPAARIVAVFGSTEAEPMAELALDELGPPELEAMAGGAGLLAGLPVPEIRLRILRNHWGTPLGPLSPEAFEGIHCPPGEGGEIVVTGAHVLPGYLGGEGDEETKIRVGTSVWHRTGDLGRLDGRGRLWLLGRCSAAVRDAQGELHPFAVECAALQIPGLARAALVPGRRILAVEALPGVRLDPEEVRRALAWALLERVLPLDAIPLDPRHNAKVDYPALAVLLRIHHPGVLP